MPFVGEDRGGKAVLAVRKEPATSAVEASKDLWPGRIPWGSPKKGAG
jgi:hypothetical protein